MQLITTTTTTASTLGFPAYIEDLAYIRDRLLFETWLLLKHQTSTLGLY